jgi:hypothetical protein
MAQFFVCCEGPQDSGVLKALIEKCAPISVVCVTHSEIKHIRVGKLKTQKHGKDKEDALDRKAYIRRLAHYANEQDSDYIAYHQDAGRQFDRVYRDVNSEFEEYRDAGFKCMAIVPKEMTESWLLADEKAYINTFGRKPARPALPNNPEDIWGKKENPGSNYPKHYLNRVLMQYHMTPNRETYEQLATGSDADTLQARCPKSFGRLIRDLQGLEYSK